jgi:hypothetical protein
LEFKTFSRSLPFKLDVLRLREVLLNGCAGDLIGLPPDGERGRYPINDPINCEKKDRFEGM